MSLTFVVGDTEPTLYSILHLEDTPATAVNLTDCTVKFQMRRDEDRRYTVNAPAVIDDALTGAVHYSWGANDLAVAGTYLAQWEVTYPGGRVQTTAPQVELTVRRQ